MENGVDLATPQRGRRIERKGRLDGGGVDLDDVEAAFFPTQRLLDLRAPVATRKVEEAALRRVVGKRRGESARGPVNRPQGAKPRFCGGAGSAASRARFSASSSVKAWGLAAITAA
jgi:hypothetical protein